MKNIQESNLKPGKANYWKPTNNGTKPFQEDYKEANVKTTIKIEGKKYYTKQQWNHCTAKLDTKVFKEGVSSSYKTQNENMSVCAEGRT